MNERKERSNSIEDLGKIMNSQMMNVMRANSSTPLELGKINGDMSLSVSSLGNAIPKGDYMISMRLKISDVKMKTSSVHLSTDEADDHSHGIGDHSHTVDLPISYRGIREGDRVLVAWVGTEPVVIDIVVSS